MDQDKEVEQKQEEQVQDEPQYSENETRAMEQGWLPKDKWEGDPEDWVPAKQFLRNGELFGRINTYKHKIQGLEKSVDALVKHNEKVFDAGYKAGLDDLKAQRRVALREGDVDAVEQIEEKIEKLEETHQEQKQEFQQATKVAKDDGMHPAWEPWVADNAWYATSPQLRGYADGVAQEIINDAKEAGKQVDFDKLLTEVSRKVKQKFPEKFGRTDSQVNRKIKDDAGEGVNRRQNKDDDIISNMSSEERQMMDVIIKSGVSKEQYLKDYKRALGKGRKD